MLAGRYLESRAKTRSGAALAALGQPRRRTSPARRAGAQVRIPAADLAAGEEFVVRPGERVATDGVIVSGRSAVDVSVLTGESMPAEVGPGDEVTGAALNLSGALVVRATRVGADTVLARITSLVTQALASKADAQRLADRIAAVFVPCVITVAVATLGFWLGAGLPAAAAGQRGGCRPGRVLPVRAGPGHADGAAGRDRPRRGARHPGPQRAGAGDGGAARRGDPGQDRHADHRRDDPARDHGGARRRRGRCCGWPGRSRTPSEHPAGQAIARAATARLGALPAVTGFARLPGRRGTRRYRRGTR